MLKIRSISAVIIIIVTSMLLLACSEKTTIRTEYIQLPPEMTTWHEEKADGNGSFGPAGVVRGERFYMLTQEEFHRVRGGDDIDAILAERDIWATEWKDYQLPNSTIPTSRNTIVIK